MIPTYRTSDPEINKNQGKVSCPEIGHLNKSMEQDLKKKPRQEIAAKGVSRIQHNHNSHISKIFWEPKQLLSADFQHFQEPMKNKTMNTYSKFLFNLV